MAKYTALKVVLEIFGGLEVLPDKNDGN